MKFKANAIIKYYNVETRHALFLQFQTKTYASIINLMA